MLFVKWLGNLRREDRLIFRKIRHDRGRRGPLRLCTLRRQSRTLILTQTLALVLRDRFAGKQDRLISRGRSVIVVATGTSGRRSRPLESRVRPAASRTVAAVEAFVPWFVPWFTPCFAAGLTAYLAARFAANFAALRTLAAVCTRPAPARFATTSATTTASAKVARSVRGVARRFRRRRFRLFHLIRYTSGFGKLPFNRWTTRFQTGARTRLRPRTIRRDRFIQVLVLLFQIHEIGDV